MSASDSQPRRVLPSQGHLKRFEGGILDPHNNLGDTTRMERAGTSQATLHTVMNKRVCVAQDGPACLIMKPWQFRHPQEQVPLF